ncbi:MAG: hypothetical protein SGJ11_06520 [Phycisphaerae bacterium]|nr:hypothetical protein [Phycisphaerae bacterium]
MPSVICSACIAWSATIPQLTGYIPFLEPLPASHRLWWIFVVPLAIGLAMAWKAVRLPTLEHYWRAVTTMVVQIILGVIGIAVGLYVLVLLVLPRLPAE